MFGQSHEAQESLEVKAVYPPLAINSPLFPHSVAGGLSQTFLHDELLYKILLRLLRVSRGPPSY